MRNKHALLALIGMAAAFSVNTNEQPNNNLTEEDVKRLEEKRKIKEKKSYEKRIKSKGLQKFTFSNVDIWALNYNSAKRKAKKKGLTI